MKAIVVIPTYNERENIEKLIDGVLSISPILDVLVVDDNSPDGTGEIVEKIAERQPRVKVMRRPGKMGLGSAYVEGFKYAIQKNYDLIIQMDADFSHNPHDISRFLELIDRYDVVIGSRYTDGVSVVNWPITRLLLSYFANVYARIVTGVPIRDLTGGFKCFKRKVLEDIELDKIVSDGYAFQIEINVLAWRCGYRMVEIPIIFVERRAGSSKMSKKIIWEAFWLVWRLRLNSLFKRR